MQHWKKHYKLSVKLLQASWKACANEQFVFTFSSSCKASLSVNLHCCKPVWIQETPAKHKARQKEGERLGGSVSRTWPWDQWVGSHYLQQDHQKDALPTGLSSKCPRAESIQEFPHRIPAWAMVLLLLPKQKLVFLNSSPLHLHLWIWRSLYLFLIKRIFISLVLYFRID